MGKLRAPAGLGKPSQAFTLVELLIVIGIISLLISILLPSLSKARRAAEEAVCMSNLRQWGIGYTMYADQNHGALPSDGAGGDAGDPIGTTSGSTPLGTAPNLPINSGGLWFNAVPPLLGQKSYIDLLYADAGGLQALPHSGSHSVFVCPSASDPVTQETSENIINGQYVGLGGYNQDATYGIPHGPAQKGLSIGSNTNPGFKSYFCYAFNSKLFGTANDGIDREAWKMTQLQPTSAVVLMTEKLINSGEYKPPAQTANTNANGWMENVGQPKACWTRFTTRHRGGGFLLFADAHVSWYKWQQVQPIVSTLISNVQDANRPSLGVIWNPVSSVGDKGGG